MKRVILFLTFLFTSIIYSQGKYYTFSELIGMEDQSGHTHLFYRLYYDYEIPNYTDMSNNIYHLDIFNNVDTLFLSDGYYSNPAWQSGGGASNLEFWNNDPTKYIYIETYCGIDCDGGLVRYDGQGLNFGIDLPASFGISKQNDSLIYIGTWSRESFKSIDGGKSAVKLNDSVSFYSIYPYNDKVVFGNYEGKLAKSTDGSITFVPINLSINTQLNNAILYDKDKLHIYLLNYKGLIVSGDTGNTWQQKYEGTNSIHISNDDSISGSIYLADDKNIYYSSNYGDTFSLFKKLDHNIAGIYKKPNSDKLYAVTKYKLVEINGDSTKTLKSLPINQKILNFFPLEVGDKWIYKERMTVIPEGDMFYSNHVIAVIGDTLMPNKIDYKIVLDNMNYRYLKVDSTGMLYEYFPDMYPDSVNNGVLYQDLIMDMGDTVESNWKSQNGKIIFLSQDSINIFGAKAETKNYRFFSITYQSSYQLTEGLGISIMNFGQDFDLVDDTLKGAIINGIVYGDTTVTGIKEQKKIPLHYTLFQNYPNPFNPSTAISYQLSAFSHVSLKVYDVLGREVKTLVNENQAAGEHKVEWNAKSFSSGIYFYRIKAGEFVSTKKMLLIK